MTARQKGFTQIILIILVLSVIAGTAGIYFITQKAHSLFGERAAINSIKESGDSNASAEKPSPFKSLAGNVNNLPTVDSLRDKPVTNATFEVGEEFDYESYGSEEDFADFVEMIRVENEADKAQGIGGYAIYNKKFKLKYLLNDYPTELSDNDRGPLSTAFVQGGFSEEAKALFTHILKVQQGDIAVKFYFQNSLVPYLHQENAVGQQLQLYALFVFFNTFDNTAHVMVNGYGYAE